MTSFVLDGLLLVVLAGMAVVGYRQGLITGALSIMGFTTGGALALLVMPTVLSRIGWLDEHQLVRAAVLIVVAFALATAGQAVTMSLGFRARSHLHRRAFRLLDSILGAVLPGVLVLLLVWFVAGALRGASSPDLERAMGGSKVLSAVDSVAPWESAQPVGDVRTQLDQTGLTKAFGGLTSAQVQPVDPPDPQAAASPAVLAAAESVVRVTGVADACLRGQEGSGFVVAPGKVVTNAHVVAGMTSPVVHVHGRSQEYAARTVVFNPSRDLAVLAVDGLPLTPLPLGVPAMPGNSVAIAGYPLDGPLKVEAARVRARIVTTGTDIYGTPGVQRAILSLYADIEQGNSGGPVLSTDGKVVGAVFSRAVGDPTTGYAVRLPELQPIVQSALGADQSVSTGACATG